LKTTLIIPTLNEIDGVRAILPRIKPGWCDQIIIVDGNSTDGTAEYVKEQGYFVIPQEEKGLRRAYLEALPYVEGDVIVTFSPDGNSVPELIPPLVAKMKEGYDMVIVSRYLDDARSYDDTFITALANKVFTLTTNLFFGGKYTDTMVIYRAYKKELIPALDLDKDSSYWLGERLIGKTMSWEMLLSIRAAKRKLKVAEIPGDEPPRTDGIARMQWRWGFAYILQMFREVFFWR
jgi:glycosyltransferase involved in cell wall biosynthesis